MQRSSVNESIRTQSLAIYYDNVRSITNKRNISMKIEMSNYKLLCFTETWLNKEHFNSVYFPDSFNVYRCDRKFQTLRRSGGVVVLVHHSLYSKQVKFNSALDSEDASEFLAIEIRIKPQPLIVYVCYLSEFNSEIALRHYQRIKFMVENNREHRIIVMGDFNLHDIVWTPDDVEVEIYLPHASTDSNTSGHRSNYHVEALDFLNKMISLPMAQLSNFRNTASNVLDLVFVSSSSEFRIDKDNHTIIEEAQQDSCHIPYDIKVDYSALSSSKIETVTVYQYKRGNYERMIQQLEAVNFQHEFNIRDVDTAYEYFVDTMKSLIEQNIPKTTIKKYSNKPK